MPRVTRIRSASLYGDRWAAEGRRGARSTSYTGNRLHLFGLYAMALVFG